MTLATLFEHPSKLQLHTDVLDIAPELNGALAALRAHTGLLGATERHAEVAQQPAVHPDHAGDPLLREAVAAAQVGGEEAAGEAVLDAVDVVEDLLFGVELVAVDGIEGAR